MARLDLSYSMVTNRARMVNEGLMPRGGNWASQRPLFFGKMAGLEPLLAKLTADAGINGGIRGMGEGLRPPQLNANLPRCRHINVPSQPGDAGPRDGETPA
jgi:hypothetical protein